MAQSRSNSTARSTKRSKRSTTNLSNLRLAPLSSNFTEPSRDHTTAKLPYEDMANTAFARQHPSYLQGKSAPSSPGILSRSSSRRHLDGGLSRRGSLYDASPAGMTYEYAAVTRDNTGGVRVEVGSGQIPKAKSDAALLVQQRLSGHGVLLDKKQPSHIHRSRSGTATPRPKKAADDDWLTRTGAATNALLQESKGQSWLTSRDSATTVTKLESDDDDVDDNYEEMAALSASTSRLQFADDELSPTSTRRSNWGSRYGSRSASRRTSRRGSVTGLRTPLAAGPAGQDFTRAFFDEDPLSVAVEPDFVDVEEGDGDDEVEVARLTENRSFGFGGMVDRLMGFHLFNVEEREEATDDEAGRRNETEEEAKLRMDTENKRKREEKEKLVAPPEKPAEQGGPQREGGWQDAAWLLSVASKAMF